MNINYGRLTDGVLTYAPNPIIGQEGEHIFTADPTRFGYKRIVRTPPPVSKGRCASVSYTEEDEVITQVWTLEPEAQSSGTDSERIAELEAALELLLSGATE